MATCLVQQAESSPNRTHTHTHTQMKTHISFLFILQFKTPGDLLKLLKGGWDFGPDPLDFIPLKVCACLHLCALAVHLFLRVCVRQLPCCLGLNFHQTLCSLEGREGDLSDFSMAPRSTRSQGRFLWSRRKSPGVVGEIQRDTPVSVCLCVHASVCVKR